MLNNSTNLKLNILAKTANNSQIVITGVGVEQKFKTSIRQLSYGNTTMSSGFITKSYTTSVVNTVSNANTVNETVKSVVSSIVPYNKFVKIATLSVAADSGFRLSNTPSLSITSGEQRGLVIKLKKTSGQSNPALFDIMCKAKEKVGIESNGLGVNLNYNIFKNPTKSTNTITRFYAGPSSISKNGEKREVKVYGDPGTSFDISILDADNNSILKSANSTVNLPIGPTSSFSGKLNKNGYYSYIQKFPPLKTIRSTAVDVGGGVTDAAQVTFDSLTDVQVGDEIHFLNSLSKPFSKTPIKVVVLDSARVCTLSEPITAADNKKVKFKRPQDFKLNIETSGTKGPNISVGFPTSTISQHSGNVLSITASASAPIQINGASAGVNEVKYFGLGINSEKTINLTYIFTGQTFNLLSGKPSATDFVLSGGRVNYSVNNITVTGDTTSTLTIKAKVVVNLTSNKAIDPAITFNINNIIS
jgi:hypothetical protein